MFRTHQILMVQFPITRLTSLARDRFHCFFIFKYFHIVHLLIFSYLLNSLLATQVFQVLNYLHVLLLHPTDLLHQVGQHTVHLNLAAKYCYDLLYFLLSLLHLPLPYLVHGEAVHTVLQLAHLPPELGPAEPPVLLLHVICSCPSVTEVDGSSWHSFCKSFSD